MDRDTHDVAPNLLNPDPSSTHQQHGQPETSCPSNTQDVEKASVDWAVEPLIVNDVFTPSVPESASLSSPSDAGRQPIPRTTVEDVPDEGEPANPAPRTPLSWSATSSSTGPETPSVSNSGTSRVEDEADTASSPPRKEETDRTTARSPSAHSAHDQPESGTCLAPKLQRRPSALDYLVSESPAATPRPALEAAYKGAAADLGPLSVFSDVSAPAAPDGRPGNVAQQRAIDPGPRLTWSSSYPGLSGAYSGPGTFQRPQALSSLYGFPPELTATCLLPTARCRPWAPAPCSQRLE